MPLKYFLRHFLRHRAVILMYHGFRGRAEDSSSDSYHGDKLWVEDFKTHVRYLREQCKVVPLDELLDRMETGRPFQDHSVAITIDDGYRSVYEYAYPVLRDAQLPAAIFVATDFIENKAPLWTDRVHFALSASAGAKEMVERLKKMPQAERLAAIEQLESEHGRKLSLDESSAASYRPLEWDELRTMTRESSGLISVGSHSHSHPILTRCAPEEISRELKHSKSLIEEKLGTACNLFCYPNGGPGDFDASTTALLKSAGYRCGLTTVPGFVRPADDAFTLRRFGVDDQDTFDDFQRTFSMGRNLKARLVSAFSR